MDERTQREKDEWNSGEVDREWNRLSTRFAHVFSCPNTVGMGQHFDSLLASAVRGNSVLVLGCFRGEEVPQYLRLGPAKIVGIDISDVAIAQAREDYGQHAEFYAMDAHQLDFPDHSFDVVVGRAILHHLNYERAIREMARVLRPGGRLICMEPLGDNPGAKLIRWLTPRAHTADEKALDKRQILWTDSYFGGEHSHYFANLTSVPVAMLTSLFPVRPDNFLLRGCDRIDRALAQTPIRTWMRYAVLNWQLKGA